MDTLGAAVEQLQGGLNSGYITGDLLVNAGPAHPSTAAYRSGLPLQMTHFDAKRTSSLTAYITSPMK